MSPQTVLISCTGLLTLNLALEAGLEFLNQSYIRRNSAAPPDFTSKAMSGAVWENSIAYTLAKSRFALLSMALSFALMIVFLAGGIFGKIERGVAGQLPPGLTQGAAYLLLVWFIFSVLGLPLGYYRTFRIEQRFGFNRMSIGLWCLDILKGMLIGLIVITPVLYAVLWLGDARPRSWWAYAAALVSAVQLLMLYLYPVMIAPLFNKFTPLCEGPIRVRILALADRLEFPVAGVFTMDGSKRSSHSNAYFTGFGRHKRIVLFDTLLATLSQDQVIAVLAHEIGHQKLRHNVKLLLLSVALTLVGFWFADLLAGYRALYDAFGFRAPAFHAALVMAAVLSGPVLGFCSPLINSLVRRYEYQADRFAVEAEGGGQDLKDALITLSAKNLSNPIPHPWYSFFHYSHPTLGERLAAIDRIA